MMEIKGVFNFEYRGGGHLVHIRFGKKEALEQIRMLAVQIADDENESICLSLFGKLTRCPEEDQGNPIEIGE